ncbi:MAG: hypothetical protein KAG53_08865 [Endozoicomonadaceae bacterium]|nr:hypothetical protein [Endozoicomonadaceae bacterium]
MNIGSRNSTSSCQTSNKVINSDNSNKQSSKLKYSTGVFKQFTAKITKFVKYMRSNNSTKSDKKITDRTISKNNTNKIANIRTTPKSSENKKVTTKTMPNQKTDKKVTIQHPSTYNTDIQMTKQDKAEHNANTQMTKQELNQHNQDLVQARKNPEFSDLKNQSENDMVVYDFIKEVFTENGYGDQLCDLKDYSSNEIFEVLKVSELFSEKELGLIKEYKTDLEGSPYW